LQAESVRYQGNWIPHALRPAIEDGVLFVGDSAGHCLPLTAEGIRTALYFGLAAGRELREVLAGRRAAEQALERYGAFSASHARPYRWMLRVQRLIPRVAPRLLGASLRAIENQRFIDWAFGRYLEIAHPRFVGAAGTRVTRPGPVSVP
jgi:flavin-dependent dehydrogenase